jgi:hypothetical protein
MGVLQLESQNEALLLKYFHNFFNKADVPWVHLVWEKCYSNRKLSNHTMKASFWWRDILRLLPKFKDLAYVSIILKDTCSPWHDFWGGLVHSQTLPHLFSFAKLKNISVAKGRAITNIHYVKTSNRSRSVCNGPLTTIACTHICNNCYLAPVTDKRGRSTPGLASATPVTNVYFW